MVMPKNAGRRITPKQRKILDFIERFAAKKGYAPSQQEIAKHFGFQSLGTVQNYIVRLERQGWLSKEWNARRGLLLSSPSHEPDATAGSAQSSLPLQISSGNTGASGSLHSSSGGAGASGSRQSSSDGLAQVVALPIVGSVAAGRPIEALESGESLEVAVGLLGRAPVDEHYVLRVKGDSMIGDGILDGDLVVIRKRPRAENGQTVVAMLGAEATIKRYYKKPDRIELHAANPKYEPILVDSWVEADRGFKIEGVLVGLVRKL